VVVIETEEVRLKTFFVKTKEVPKFGFFVLMLVGMLVKQFKSHPLRRP